MIKMIFNIFKIKVKGNFMSTKWKEDLCDCYRFVRGPVVNVILLLTFGMCGMIFEFLQESFLRFRKHLNF